MEKPKVSKTFVEALKHVRRGLQVIWIGALERFAIAHVHEYTAHARIIMIIEDAEEGKFRHPDVRDLNYLKHCVDWESIDKYPNVNDLADYFINERKIRKAKKIKNRQSWIKDFIRDNRKGVKEAVRRMWYEGITHDPNPKPKEKKIQVSVKEDLNSLGYTQHAGLIVPTSLNDVKK